VAGQFGDRADEQARCRLLPLVGTKVRPTMVTGVPTNVAGMNVWPRSAKSGLSALSLQFQVLDAGPDWPVVQVLADGRDPFAEAAPDWRGFDPDKILAAESPLLPVAGLGRRVAVYRRSCGEACCGVIAPVIVASPDGSRISWTDFRD
jgi:hypothetical protein